MGEDDKRAIKRKIDNPNSRDAEDSKNAKKARKTGSPKWLYPETSGERFSSPKSHTSDKDIHNSDSSLEYPRASSSEKDTIRDKAEKKVEELIGNILKTLKKPLIGELNYFKSQYIDILNSEIKTKKDFMHALSNQEMKDQSAEILAKLEQKRTTLEDIKFEDDKILSVKVTNFQSIVTRKLLQEELLKNRLEDQNKDKAIEDKTAIISLLAYKSDILEILNNAHKRLAIISKEVNHLKKIENTGINLQITKEEMLLQTQQENTELNSDKISSIKDKIHPQIEALLDIHKEIVPPTLKSGSELIKAEKQQEISFQ